MNSRIHSTRKIAMLRKKAWNYGIVNCVWRTAGVKKRAMLIFQISN